MASGAAAVDPSDIVPFCLPTEPERLGCVILHGKSVQHISYSHLNDVLHNARAEHSLTFYKYAYIAH